MCGEEKTQLIWHSIKSIKNFKWGTFCSNDPYYRQASGGLQEKRSLSFALLDYERCSGILLNFR